MTGTAPRALHELTSVRAFAALVVVLFHFLFDARDPRTFLNNLVAHGHLGVDMFFILSGFILTHVYAPQMREAAFSYYGFIVNRIARIYPLHLFMILVFIVAYQIGAALGLTAAAEGQDWGALPWHLLLLHAWGMTSGHAWNFPSWSVSAEFFAYLIFPAVLVVVMRMRPAAALIGATGLFLVAGEALVAYGYVITKMMYDFGVIRIFFEFLAGVAMYFVFERARPSPILTRLALAVVLAGIVALAGYQADERLIVLLIGGMIYLLACLGMEEKPNFLRSRPLVYLGEISYATYMVHILVLTTSQAAANRLGLTEGAGALAVFFAAMATIYVSSSVLYHLIERPARSALRRRLMRART